MIEYWFMIRIIIRTNGEQLLIHLSSFWKIINASHPQGLREKLMEKIMKDLSESSLVVAIEANLFEIFKLFKQWSQAEVHDSPELLWTITEMPFSLFNSILRPRLSPEIVDGAIDAAIARCKLKNVPMLWFTGPSTKPADLGSRLLERGFQFYESPGMAVDLDSLPEDLQLPQNFMIERVDNDEDLRKWCQVMCEVFEMPKFVEDAWLDFKLSLGFDPSLPIRHYLGSLNDEVVATSTLFLGAGVAGIYDVSTLERARRKGIGSAMTAAPLMEARGLGYRVGILNSSEIGFNVYRKVGFQEYCKINQYVWSVS